MKQKITFLFLLLALAEFVKADDDCELRAVSTDRAEMTLIAQNNNLISDINFSTQSIIVNSKTVENDPLPIYYDAGLRITPVHNQAVCFDLNFENIPLIAVYRLPNIDIAAENINFGDLTFEWKLIAGVNVLSPLANSGSNFAAIGGVSHEWNISASDKIVGCGTYEVTPCRNYRNGIASSWSYGTPILFTLTRFPKPTVCPVEDSFLYNGSPFRVEFDSEYTDVELCWEVIDTNSNPTQSQLGLPENGRKYINVQSLYNTTNAMITETIKVTPIFATQNYPSMISDCPGIPMFFNVTVYPSNIGIETHHGQTEFVSPNPTTGILSIKGELENVKIELYSQMGSLIGSYAATAPETTIDISHLPAGIYFVKAGTTIAKIIKQ